MTVSKENKGMSYLFHMFADRLHSKLGQRVLFINDTKWSIDAIKPEPKRSTDDIPVLSIYHLFTIIVKN